MLSNTAAQNHRARNIVLIALGLGIAAIIGTIALSWMVFARTSHPARSR